MGFWGFTFSIELNKDKFTSTYWEDTHKKTIYKAQLTDSVLVDNVFVDNKEQSLILKSKPTFMLGENMEGYLTFETNPYYRTSNYMAKEIYDAENMDKLKMAGALYFKCKVREVTEYD